MEEPGNGAGANLAGQVPRGEVRISDYRAAKSLNLFNLFFRGHLFQQGIYN